MSDADETRRLVHALLAWADASPKGVRGGGARFRALTLHHRPDPTRPEVQLRFLATDVEGAPMIRVEYFPDEAAAPPVTGDRVEMSDTWTEPEEGPRDAAAVCAACSATGTVGWVRYAGAEDSEATVYRYCARCWAPEAAWHQAKYEEEAQRVMDEGLRGDGRSGARTTPRLSMRAATWHQPLALVRKIERAMHPTVPPSAPDLAEMAAALEGMAAELEGAMPMEVEAFIRRYRRGAG